jgi:hypothetical protein
LNGCNREFDFTDFGLKPDSVPTVMRDFRSGRVGQQTCLASSQGVMGAVGVGLGDFPFFDANRGGTAQDEPEALIVPSHHFPN